MIALSGRYGYRKRGLSPKAQAKLEAKAASTAE